MKLVCFILISVYLISSVELSVIKVNDFNEESKPNESSGSASVSKTQIISNLSSSFTNAVRVNYSQREKTWLLTQQWMIDNINRLHHELNELARDYNQHVERSREEQSQKEAEFVRDITSLRADHSVIEQHQQQILDYIKVNSKNNNINNIDNNNQISSQIERMISLKPAYYKIAASKSLKKRRHLLSNLLKREKQFEDEAKQNVSQLYDKLNSLNDITFDLFEDVQDIQSRLLKSDSEKKD